ncbi:predicted protein [Arabidopsis lyrata subsp. lyrata]|uniref:Predicted protein n=1 Tax=Arabidopsis lyrata subsp. lyrata TaxID=81972 RepID=D7ME12_ARALL|nr:predicted protein [Arabidopsis lyrata subsp. lyrata]
MAKKVEIYGGFGEEFDDGVYDSVRKVCVGVEEKSCFKMLKFKTNKATYQVLGAETEGYEYVGTSFVLGETDHKIVGFHGNSLYGGLVQIGVYVSPINNA